MVSSGWAGFAPSSAHSVSRTRFGVAATVVMPRSTMPSSPARTSCVEAGVTSLTAPRTTCTAVSESVAASAKRVPTTSMRPDGVVIAAGRAPICSTSATSRPEASVIRRGSAASIASCDP